MNLTSLITKNQRTSHFTSCFKSLLMASFILSMFVLNGCGENEDYELYSTINGTVSDYETAAPLDNATITLSPSGQTATSDINGSFSFTNLDSRQYTLTVQKNGYQPNRKEVHAISGEQINIPITLKEIPN